MRTQDQSRAIALADVFTEDIAMASGVAVNMLGAEWLSFTEAAALVCFAQGTIERQAAVGALVYCASRLP